MAMINTLKRLRQYAKSMGGAVETHGLSKEAIHSFEKDPNLLAAVARASAVHARHVASHSHLLTMNERDAVHKVQDGFLNFYGTDTLQPYIALAAQGPWIITATGAVVYETGGYGMLGFGHNPAHVSAAMSEPQVMANIMTPSLQQAEFMRAIRAEVGNSRDENCPRFDAAVKFGDNCPYEKFVCLNSGSESVSLAMRIMDTDAKAMTAEDGPHPGQDSVLVSLKGSFHGRTDRPAMASDSTRQNYKQHVKSYSDKALRTVEPNNVAQLKELFEELEEKNVHIEGFLMEPVMGEGNPGMAITRDFYDTARELVDKHRSLLLVDSIQASLRATGNLSLMDYPDFQTAAPPDFETFAKSINGGQFPLSVLALGPRVPEIYIRGLYGNTMTTNPRALAVACATLEEMTPDVKSNIQAAGLEFKEVLEGLRAKHPDVITKITGTGLLLAAHLDEKYKVVGGDHSVERLCRLRGVNVIHGGKNALRFTPWYLLSRPEMDLIADVIDSVITQYKQLHNL